MAEYRLDVRSILDQVGASLDVSDQLQLDELVVGDERFVMRAAPTFEVSVSNTGDELVAIGSVIAPVTASCARCLCDFTSEITGEVEGMWPRPGAAPTEGEDYTGEVDSAGFIDLEPALVAALVVEAPFAPLHDEACKGLCPACGADLNTEQCSCHEEATDEHPFSALKGLLGEDVAEGEPGVGGGGEAGGK